MSKFQIASANPLLIKAKQKKFKMNDLLIKGRDNRLKIQVKEAPIKSPVTRDEVGSHLKLDSDQISADSDLIDRLIKGATNWAENFLNRQLITATYVNYFNEFIEPLQLWNPPVQSIVHIKYLDGDGVEQTMDSSDYVLDARVAPAEISLANDKTWPSTLLNEVNVVWCEFKAGYGDNPDNVPENIRDAILMKVTQMYDNRTPGVEEKVSVAENLLLPYRVRLL